MMNKTQTRLADKCVNIEPVQGDVLIAVNRLRTYKELGHKASPADPEVDPKDVVPGETEMKLEATEIQVNYRYQTGVVLKASDDTFKVGDTVIFELGAVKEFDYIKGVSIIPKFMIKFKVNEGI